MRKAVLFFLILFISVSTNYGQSSDEDIIENMINTMFDGMREVDTEKIKSLFVEGAKLKNFSKSFFLINTKEATIDDFLKSLSQAQPNSWDEQIQDPQIMIDAFFAQAWVPYSFYLNGELSHCGVNVFTLLKDSNQWKIESIQDTRRTDCEDSPDKVLSDKLHNSIDQWHEAAAKADENYFFNFMKPEGIYIGTDPSELWEVEDFEKWAMQYFQRESAWDFKSYDRNLYFSQNKEVAWFDELLDTWMGICRGSGVLEISETGKWTLKHYHLSVTVLNDDIQEFLKIAPKKE